MNNVDSKYTEYAESVVSGQIVACKAIKQACQRYLDWFNRDDIYFDTEKADKVIRFLTKLKHYSGKTANEFFKPTLCEMWCIYAIFGFYWVSDNTRVTQKALIMVSRKFGKSFFAAAISLYCLIGDGEAAAQCLNVASNKEQAKLLFQMEQILCKQLDPNKKFIKILRDRISFDKTHSYAQVLSSDSDGLDGASASFFVCDETHSYKSSELWDVLISSQGFRKNPLAFQISTAGFNLTGFLYKYYETCKDILNGNKTDDTQFIAIYELDEDDDWTDESVWIKSNPNLGETVELKYLRNQVISAKNNPSLEVGVKTKNFNIWCQAKDVWIPDSVITSSFDKINLDDFRGEKGYIGVDLSAISDLTSWAVMFPPNPTRAKHPDKYVFSVFTYLPDESLSTAYNGELYREFKRGKFLTTTPGNCVDYDYILSDMLNLYKDITLMKVGYDSWNATQWATSATNSGLPLEPVSQSISNFNRPTKEFTRLILSGKVVIDYNPIVRWCFQNVQIKRDYNDNEKPTKANDDNTKKIDCVIAIIEALCVYLLDDYIDLSYLFSDNN